MSSRRDLYLEPLKERVQYLEQQLAKVEAVLVDLPEGHLTFSKVSGHTRYYLTDSCKDSKKSKYLGKDQSRLVKQLAKRRYLEELKRSLEKELKALKRVADRPMKPAPEDVYDASHPALKELVDPMLLSDEAYQQWWLEEYRQNASGEKAKSRIEKIIDQFFRLEGIVYVYEPALYLDGYGPARPDFVVLEPKTRRTIYMEHFGMMDKEEYRVKNMRKLACYHANGYYEGINFIATMESESNPMDLDLLEEILRAYFK